MKITYLVGEMIGASSGSANQNLITINYLKNHPEVEKLAVIQVPIQFGPIPPLKMQWNGITIFTPKLKINLKNAVNSFKKEKLEFKEKLKFALLRFGFKLKRISTYDSYKIKKAGLFHVVAAAILSFETPYPNPFLEEIANCIKKTNPDIIQTQMENLSIAGALARGDTARHFSTQFTIEGARAEGEEGTLNYIFSQRLIEALEWLVSSNQVDLFIPVSETVKIDLKKFGIDQNKMRVVSAPIDIGKFPKINKVEAREKLGLPKNRKIILSVGRMTPRKRFQDIIKILPQFPKNVILYIKRGKSMADTVIDESKAIRSLIKKLKLYDRVIINEEILPYDQMVYVYSACDVAVFPFLNEPGGNCGMEALANRKPLVVYDSGYFPYYIKDNGFIVKPKNLDELYEKIKILLDDEKLANEMGEKSGEMAQIYDINVIGEKLVNLYKEFL